MFRCGQITHFALQALVVSMRTVLGNRLNARLNALPMKEQDILDSFVLSCPVLLITFCSLSDLPGIACHIAGDVQNARPFSIKNLIVGFQLLEPIQITRSITAGCKARCLRCRPKMFSTWRKPRLRAFLSCRLGLELFARPHNDPVIRISS